MDCFYGLAAVIYRWKYTARVDTVLLLSSIVVVQLDRRSDQPRATIFGEDDVKGVLQYYPHANGPAAAAAYTTATIYIWHFMPPPHVRRQSRSSVSGGEASLLRG